MLTLLLVVIVIGRTRYERLILIGRCCVPLRLEALKAAIVEAKSGSDITRYKDAWQLLRSVAPDEPEAKRDDEWIESTELANRNETTRLETELKGYKNNLIKESIRVRFTPFCAAAVIDLTRRLCLDGQ
jgi:COP9 signalosome complex subunit 1